MTAYTWSSQASGSWGVAANWGPNGLPTNTDTVSIGAAGVTVGISTGVAASAYMLTTNAGTTLDITNNGTVGGKATAFGTLSVVDGAVFNGIYEQSGGLFTVGGPGATFTTAIEMTGGTINVQTGALVIADGGAMNGTLTGAGELHITGGQLNLNSGFSAQLSAIVLDNGAKLALNGLVLNYANNITVNNGSFALFGSTLNATGPGLFSGVIGYGTFNEHGRLVLGTTQYHTYLDNGALLNDYGTVVQSNQLNLGPNDGNSGGDSGGKLAIVKGGTYDINGNWNIQDPSQVGAITNAGTLAKTAGGKTSAINPSLTSTGTINVGLGQLQVDGAVNSVSGTVSGAGTFGIGGVGGTGHTSFSSTLALKVATLDQQGGVLTLANPLAYAGNWEMSGGVLDLDNKTTVLTLSGRSNFDGGIATGYGGTISISGTSEVGGNWTFGGPDLLAVTGTVDQTGNIHVGLSSNATVAIASGASWAIEGDGSILGSYGVIDNAGLLAEPNGSGNSVIQDDLSSTGTLLANGTLTLADPYYSQIGGTLSGTGLIDLAGTTTLLGGLAINVAALDVSAQVTLTGSLSDAGLFSEVGAGVLDLGGNVLALSGATTLDGGSLTDQGTLACAGATTVGAYTVTGGAELLVSNQADQAGALTLSGVSGGGTLLVAAGASYAVLDDADIIVSSIASGAVVVAGQLTESGTGTGVVAAAITLAATGTLAVADQVLDLEQGGSLGGTVSGAGGTLALTSGGSFTLASGFSDLSAGLEVNNAASVLLGANQAYAGDFVSQSGTIGLSGDTLSLTGTALLGAGDLIGGPGTLLASGSTTLGMLRVSGGATLALAGQAAQVGVLTIGTGQNTPTTDTLAVEKGASLSVGESLSITGSGTLSVAGTLTDPTNSTTAITTAIVDTGTIAANLGTLQVYGNVSAGSTGSFTVGGHGMLQFETGVSVSAATHVVFGGGPAGGGTLLVTNDLQGFDASISGFTSGNIIQLAGIAGNSVSGTYANAAHTQLAISDTNGDQITLNFAGAQNLGSITFTSTASGYAELIHT